MIEVWIIFILCIVFLLYFGNWNNQKDYEILKNSMTKIKKILYQSPYMLQKEITLYPSKNYSYTENKNTIYLVIKNKNDQYYSEDTILLVLIHEMSHIISNTLQHTDEFYEIEDTLLKISKELDIISDYEIDNNYPCLYQ